MQQSASDDSDSDSDDEIRRLEEEIQKMKRLKELKRAKKAKAQKQAADPVVAPAAKQQNKVPGPAAGEGGPARFGATKCPAQRLNTPPSAAPPRPNLGAGRMLLFAPRPPLRVSPSRPAGSFGSPGKCIWAFGRLVAVQLDTRGGSLAVLRRSRLPQAHRSVRVTVAVWEKASRR